MMLDLDYRRSSKPFPWAGVAVLALALAVLSFTGVYYLDMLNKTGLLEAQSRQDEMAAKRKIPGSQREANDLAQEIKHANEVLSQITLPWDRLFEAVEWSSGKDVALLTIEPDAERHEVKISGEAKNIAAILNYIRHLAAQEVFSNVYLQSHQVQQRSREKPVRFALVVVWKVAT